MLQTKQTNMIFRPLALVAAIAGLSSAEVSYNVKEGFLASAISVDGDGTSTPSGGAFELGVDRK